jgi:hypothetical protein
VYVEISAPDFRFLIAAVLAVVLMIRQWRNPEAASISVFRVASLMTGMFACWLATSGNGRYFMTGLLLIGPLLVALIFRMPGGRRWQWALLSLICALQAAALQVNSPWSSESTWTRLQWGERYLNVDRLAVARLGDEPTAYVSFSPLSTSFVAPLFPENSHWVNLSPFSADGISPGSRQDRFLQNIFNKVSRIRLFEENQAKAFDPQRGVPNEKGVAQIDRSLGRFGLRLQQPLRCELVPSTTMADAVRVTDDEPADRVRALHDLAGFLSCDLVRDPLVYPGPLSAQAKRAAAIFELFEQACPSYFPGGQMSVATVTEGFTRNYLGNDIYLLLIPGQGIYAKYYRSISLQLLATEGEIRSVSLADRCRHLRGRALLPWGREL